MGPPICPAGIRLLTDSPAQRASSASRKVTSRSLREKSTLIAPASSTSGAK